MRLIQEYSGRLRYRTDVEEGPHQLLVAVPCWIGSLGYPVRALVDTASEWCILGAEVAEALEIIRPADEGQVRLHSRFGLATGNLERIFLRLEPEDGEALDLEATWFISEEWPGPTVIGWRGCLERLCFAVDPREDWFYFAGL